MKKYEIKILYEAYLEIEEYVDYVERMTFSKQKADEELAELLSVIMKLNFMHHIYPKVYKDFHSLLHKTRRIFYKIYEDQNLIVVFHVLGQAQNYEDIL